MGAHPKAPASITINKKTVNLDKCIESFPEQILGERVYSTFKELPFLFKVLSAGQALSIQAHPNKQQAAKLHEQDPEHYPDNNHKPEIAIALSNLTALAGFKSYDQLIVTLENYPEISTFIGNDILPELKRNQNLSEQQQRPLVKNMYGRLMQKSLSEKDELLKAIEKLTLRLSQKNNLSSVEKKFFELRDIYPGADSGLFSLFLLNMVELNSGQGLFLKAGLPHAYLKGDIVECMANSDNVVRAGLTPKFQDVDTLLDILTYETSPVKIQQGDYQNGELVYNTPVPEFQVTRIDLDKNVVKQKTDGIQILLINHGQIEISWGNNDVIYTKGQSVLIPACMPEYIIKSPEKAGLFKVTVP
jgi:mannose-6-phosphate isomerase